MFDRSMPEWPSHCTREVCNMYIRRSSVIGFQWWSEVAHKACCGHKHMRTESFAMLLPCGTRNTHMSICSGSGPQSPIDSWYDPRLLDPDLFHPYSLTDLLFIPLKIVYHLQFLKFFMVYLLLATIFISTVKEKKTWTLVAQKEDKSL